MGIFKPDSKDKGKPTGQPSLRQQAIRYVERGEYTKAIAAYETLLAGEMDKAAVYNIIGDLYEKLGNAELAFEQYDCAITEYVKEDQYRNAIGVAKKVLRYHKDRVEMYKRLADLYAQEGRVGDAILALNQYAEEMRGSESAHIVTEIKNTISQLKEKSLLVQSAMDLGQEEAGIFLPPRHETVTPTPQPQKDPEEEARRLEEERLVRELELEIEQELFSEQQQPSEAPAEEKPPVNEVPVEVREAPSGEEKPASVTESLEQEEDAKALEKLIEDAMQAVHKERAVPETSKPEAGEPPSTSPEVTQPEDKEASQPEPEEDAQEVTFLELDQLDNASGITGESVFAELSSKPYDSEHFKSRFEQEISRSDRYGRSLAFILVQIEFLRRNHKDKARAGKKAQPKGTLVRKVADTFRALLRDTDILAYNADGRVVLILPETEKEGALFVAQRLKGWVVEFLSEQGIENENGQFWLGVVGYPKDAKNKEELVRRTQRLMALGEKKEYSGKVLMLAN